MWMMLGWLAIVWLGLHTLYMLNPDRKEDQDDE